MSDARKAIEDAVNEKDEAWRARLDRELDHEHMMMIVVGVAFFVLGVLAGITWGRAMKVVYIAGPFRGPTAWDIERNVRRAEELAFEVFKLGAMPLTPHANTRFFHGQGPDAFWLDGTLELLRRCDALITVDDWARSSGARGEVSDASARGIPVFHNVPDLAAWLGR